MSHVRHLYSSLPTYVSQMCQLSVKYWVVDYDIPIRPHARRRSFYRALHRILVKHDIVADRSTQSVWVMDNEGIAKEIHALALGFGRSHLYSALRVD